MTLNGSWDEGAHYMLDYAVPYWKRFLLWARGVAKGRLGLHLGDGYATLGDPRLVDFCSHIH